MSQLSEYLNANLLFGPVQSAYRPNHSTETAIVNIVTDLLLTLDDGKVSVLTLLDLSAAFDTIDHILLHRLEHAFGITGTAFSLIRSYLSDRDQTVVVNGLKSEPFRLLYGVPQGSVLGPILFVLYTKPLDDIFDRHSVCHHSFADDTQLLQNSSSPVQLDTTISAMQDCVSDVKSWMTLNRLQLNNGKTEAMLVVYKRTSASGLIPQSISVGDTEVYFSDLVKNLGVTLDSSLFMLQQVTNTGTAAYIELWRISSIC